METIASAAAVKRALKSGAVVVMTAAKIPDRVGWIANPTEVRSRDYIATVDKPNGTFERGMTMSYPDGPTATYTGSGWSDKAGTRRLFPSLEEARAWVASNSQALADARAEAERLQAERVSEQQRRHAERVAKWEREEAERVANFTETCHECGGRASYGKSLSHQGQDRHYCNDCTAKRRAEREAQRLATLNRVIGQEKEIGRLLGLTERGTSSAVFLVEGETEQTVRLFWSGGDLAYLPKGHRRNGRKLPDPRGLVIKQGGRTIWNGPAEEWQDKGLDAESALVAAALSA